MKCHKYAATLAILLCAGVAANADETSAVDAGESPSAQTASVADELLDMDAFEDGGALSDEELNSHRAKELLEVSNITINDQDQDGNVSDNVAIGTTNGDNIINGDAFSDSSGFLSTVQNTGNNVLIQSSTIINVTVETPGN